MDQKNVFLRMIWLGVWWERKRRLCLLPVCPSVWTPYVTGKLRSLVYLHLLRHTHLDLLCLKIGKWKCSHEPCKTQEWEMPSPFIILSEKNCLGSFLKRMNERPNQELIMYQGSSLRLQLFSASAWLQCFSTFWLEKGRFQKRCELHAQDLLS